MNTVLLSRVDRLLTGSLVVGPVLCLIADSLYAVRGWESDGTGGIFHVLGAVAYTLVLLRVASWADDGMAAALLVVGSIGVAGNAAYGFDAIHVALGDVSLVDQPGAANLIKPLGLAFPLLLLMCAFVLRKVAPRWVAGLIGMAAVAFPVANIGNIAPLGVAVSLALAVGFGALAIRPPLKAPAPAPAPGAALA